MDDRDLRSSLILHNLNRQHREARRALRAALFKTFLMEQKKNKYPSFLNPPLPMVTRRCLNEVCLKFFYLSELEVQQTRGDHPLKFRYCPECLVNGSARSDIRFRTELKKFTDQGIPEDLAIVAVTKRREENARRQAQRNAERMMFKQYELTPEQKQEMQKTITQRAEETEEVVKARQDFQKTMEDLHDLKKWEDEENGENGSN